jgi:hypothetical protein
MIIFRSVRFLLPMESELVTDLPSYKDFIDCGEGQDRVVVDNLDVYQNCEVVNGQRLVVIDPNRDISNLMRFPENSTMDTNRDISNLMRFPENSTMDTNRDISNLTRFP